MKTASAMVTLAITATTVLVGCAAPEQQYTGTNYPPTQSSTSSSSSYAIHYGVVDSIQKIPAARAGATGAGAVLGGVIGGLLGNQVGGGNGRTVATVAGAVGGAVVGNQVEQRNQAPAYGSYQIGVRLDNGSYQSIEQESLNDLQIGSRARIDNGRAYRN